MPSKDPMIQKAFKDGVITKGQYDKLSDGLLKGIIKKKKGAKSKAPPRASRTAVREPAKAKKGGVKEVRHKMGKEKHKRGRPKGGSKVEVEK